MDADNSHVRQFFESLENFNITKLSKCKVSCIRMVLPLLTRCGLCQPPDIQNSMQRKKAQLLMKLLLGFKEVNFLVEALSTDFNEVSGDCHNLLALRLVYFICLLIFPMFTLRSTP